MIWLATIPVRASMSVMGRRRVNPRSGQPSGVASIIITVILGLAIVGIVAGLTSSAITQTKLASDNDQSSRALNAALAGINGLVAQVNANPLFSQTDCNGNTGEQQLSPASNGQDITITCATATNQGDTLEGFLQRDQSVLIDLSNAQREDTNHQPLSPRLYDGADSMSLQWNQHDTDVYPFSKFDSVGPGKSFTSTDMIQFPTLNSLGAWPNKPAAMEISFMWCRKTGSTPSITPVPCQYSAGLGPTNDINPFTKSLPTYSTTIVPWLPNKDGIPSECAPTNVASGIGTNLDCHAPLADPVNHNLSGFFINRLPGVPADLSTNYNVMVKITARYAGTHYAVSFGGPHTVGQGPGRIFDWPYTKLDVTARSGSIYRRILATKTTKYSNYDITSYALWSGSNICKNLYIYQQPQAAFPGENPGKNNCPGPDANEP